MSWRDDPEMRKRYHAEYYARHATTMIARAKRSQRMKRYGLSDEAFNAMYVDQDGKCAICRRPIIGQGIQVDHNHSTGKVRGLLCVRCNVTCGLLESDPETVAKLIVYISNSQ